MNYSYIYQSLVERGQARMLDSYTESHHIVPKCLGGTDDKSNLVDLTPEEHYVAHQLLVKMYPNNGRLAHAAHMMTVNRATNKSYGWVRRRLSESMKKNNPNAGGNARREYNAVHGSPNKGYTHTEETKQLLSELRMGNKNPNADGKARLTKTFLIDVDTNEVTVYNSLKEAEAKYNANHSSVHRLRKLNKPFKGFYWCVGEEEYNVQKEHMNCKI